MRCRRKRPCSRRFRATECRTTRSPASRWPTCWFFPEFKSNNRGQRLIDELARLGWEHRLDACLRPDSNGGLGRVQASAPLWVSLRPARSCSPLAARISAHVPP